MNRRTFLTAIAVLPLASLVPESSPDMRISGWIEADAARYIAYIVEDHSWVGWSIGKDGVIERHGPGWPKQ